MDEPAILPSLPIVPLNLKSAGTHMKDYLIPMDVDQPIDPNEPTY